MSAGQSSKNMTTSGLCCGQIAQSSPTGDTDDILLIGLQGSGKTLLGQRLRTVYGKAPAVFRFTTTETNGSQDFRVPTFKGCPFKDVKIRECGGSMQPLWKNWYARPIKAVVFTLDISDASSLAAAGVELYRLLQQPELSSKPVCLVLTKMDLPITLCRAELNLALGLDELERLYPGRLRVVSVSSVRTPDECPQLEALVEWMMEVKAREAGVVLAKRK